MKTLAFFNNKGGVGKTSLVYHVAWMMSLLGIRVVVADLDPQANATNKFLLLDDIERLWTAEGVTTIYGAIRPLIRGTGDVEVTRPVEVADRLHLIVGDLSLSEFEDRLSETWPRCLSGDEWAFLVTTAFSRVIRGAASLVDADVVIIVVGPNLGAINRAALIAAEHVVIPLSADLFAMRGLENVGPKLIRWRQDWLQRKDAAPSSLGIELPDGEMRPLGYVVSRYSAFARGPARGYQRWLDRAPSTYRRAIENAPLAEDVSIENDPSMLAQLKDYRSLMPLAQDANKPMFLLKPADGAIGGHQAAVGECREDFRNLATVLLARIGITKPLALV